VASDQTPSGRSETEEERLDRNLIELLAEVRVAITGVQVLFAFLLIVPFNEPFAGLNDVEHGLYLVSLLGAGAATVALVAPIAQHRATFRLQDKPHMVRRANRFALLGLAFLALAMTAAVALVTSVVFGPVAAVLTGAGSGLAFALCWGVLPLGRRRALR
jgi:hypothetical protein